MKIKVALLFSLIQILNPSWGSDDCYDCKYNNDGGSDLLLDFFKLDSVHCYDEKGKPLDPSVGLSMMEKIKNSIKNSNATNMNNFEHFNFCMRARDGRMVQCYGGDDKKINLSKNIDWFSVTKLLFLSFLQEKQNLFSLVR
jgi:hypothetical protein